MFIYFSFVDDKIENFAENEFKNKSKKANISNLKRK